MLQQKGVLLCLSMGVICDSLKVSRVTGLPFRPAVSIQSSMSTLCFSFLFVYVFWLSAD